MKDPPAIAGLAAAADIVSRRSDSQSEKRYAALHYAALARQLADENKSTEPKTCLADSEIDSHASRTLSCTDHTGHPSRERQDG